MIVITLLCPTHTYTHIHTHTHTLTHHLFDTCAIVQFNHGVILKGTNTVSITNPLICKHTNTINSIPKALIHTHTHTHTHTQGHSHIHNYPLQLVQPPHPVPHTNIRRLATTYQETCSPLDAAPKR